MVVAFLYQPLPLTFLWDYVTGPFPPMCLFWHQTDGPQQASEEVLEI